ncbi:MAG TPA: hydrogenase/urease maturation nickel metallochaperone HypA [Streptosporangiaceae bacterium]|nr:hydrogenase/urease maturation nickel metallochaperone HypA [Streptosporangiaceae bacterium]
MHEYGLCEGVLDAVLVRAAGRPVAGIRVRCGVRHAVDPPSMVQAFAMLAAGTAAADAVVTVVTVPATVTCRDCGAAGESTDLVPACPGCGSVNVEMTGGDELTLESLTYAEQPAQPEPGPVFERRDEPARHLATQAEAVAAACHAMAIRFHRGGKLVVFGTGGASADAQHVAVEFVHPVIVGKRALPAIALTTDVATVTGIAERDGVDAIFAHQLRALANTDDIALGISPDGNSPSVLAGLRAASELGLLTIALAGGDGSRLATSMAVDHLLVAASSDPRVVKEVHVTMYHILWELVHVFFEQPGVLGPGVVA